MARNTTAMKRGWNYDKPNSLLKAMVDGAEAFALSTTKGISTAGQTLTPDSTRSYMSIGIGSRATEKDITMTAAATQHLDPVQINLNIIGANPTDSSTVNSIYQLITHDTTAMSYLRLKCADWNIALGVNALDAYIFQGEIVCSGGPTIGNEVSLIGLVLDAGATAVTCGSWSGITITMRGAGIPSEAYGININNAGSGTLTNGIRILGSATITSGITMTGTMTQVFNFTSIVTAVSEDNLAAPNKAGSIAILTPAGAVAYINYYDGARA